MHAAPLNYATVAHAGGYIGEVGMAQRPDKRAGAYSEPPRPVCENHPLAVQCEPPAVAPVPQLRFDRCPVAVLRRVPAVVVPALKPCSGWTAPHIAEKRGEVTPPLIGHRDTAGAVVAIDGVSRVVASRLRIGPGVVLRRLRRPVRTLIAGAVAEEASAAPRVTAHQRLGEDANHRPAVALASPARSSADVGVALNGDKATEAGTRDVSCRHTGNIT